MNKPLSLSDHQLRQIHAAAKALLPLQRSDFVRGVKRRLAITHPTKPCRLRSVPNWHSITSPPPAHEIAHGSRALASERHPALSRAVS
jgi:hypothetical protein